MKQSKTHIKKAEFTNKILRLLHKNSTGKVKKWNFEKEQTETIEQGLLRSAYNELSVDKKLAILDLIFVELQSTHNSILSDRFERRRIRARDAKRLANGYKHKKKTSLEQYKALKNGESIPAHAVTS